MEIKKSPYRSKYPGERLTPRCTLVNLSWDTLSLTHHEYLQTLHPLQLGAYDLSLWRSHTYIPSPHKPSWPLRVPGRQGHRGITVEQAATGLQGVRQWPLREPRKGSEVTLEGGWKEKRVGLEAAEGGREVSRSRSHMQGNSYYNQSCDRDKSFACTQPSGAKGTMICSILQMRKWRHRAVK